MAATQKSAFAVRWCRQLRSNGAHVGDPSAPFFGRAACAAASSGACYVRDMRIAARLAPRFVLARRARCDAHALPSVPHSAGERAATGSLRGRICLGFLCSYGGELEAGRNRKSARLFRRLAPSASPGLQIRSRQQVLTAEPGDSSKNL